MSHYEESLQRDVDRLRGKIREMAELAEQALDGAWRAFSTRSRQLAYTVILRDRRIDALEKEVDRLCLEFIVRQQPAAKHLRFAYTAIKINQEIERIGDYAESVARQVLKLANLHVEISLPEFEEIAQRSVVMLRDAVRAFLEENADLAQRAMALEEEADGIKSAINAQLFRLRQEDKLPLEALTPLLTIARRFERATDQAKNICEEAVYMTTGEFSKHLGGEVWRMVFIDQRNCASQMAEAIGNALKQPQFVFSAAGVETGPINPAVIEFMAGKGYDLSRNQARSIEQLPNIEFSQVLVALAPEAKRSLGLARKALRLDWTGLPDPCAGDLSATDRQAALEKTYQFLHQNISDLCEAVLADEID